MEPQVTIRCREADLALVESILPEAINNYSQVIKKPCNITIAKDNFLPADTWVNIFHCALCLIMLRFAVV